MVYQEGNNFLDICNCSSICCKLMLAPLSCELLGLSMNDLGSFWKVIVEGLLLLDTLRFTPLPLTTYVFPWNCDCSYRYCGY